MRLIINDSLPTSPLFVKDFGPLISLEPPLARVTLSTVQFLQRWDSKYAALPSNPLTPSVG